jgi:hypothetical protein
LDARSKHKFTVLVKIAFFKDISSVVESICSLLRVQEALITTPVMAAEQSIFVCVCSLLVQL